MALTQTQRISLSKKLVSLESEKAIAETTKANIAPNIADAQALDDSNKSLLDTKTELVNKYQTELERYDGNGRTQTTEQNLLDSVNKVSNERSVYFPNVPTSSPPSIPASDSGAWKHFIPFALSYGLGKDYLEAFVPVDKEQTLIDAFDAAVAAVEARPQPNRSTGQQCVAGGFGDVLQPDQVTIDALTTLTEAVQTYKSFVETTQESVPTDDSDVTRSSQNAQARSNISQLLRTIGTWQDLEDFAEVPPGLSGSCPLFDAAESDDFVGSKLRSNELDLIKSAIADRSEFIVSRQSQLEGYLGTVEQDVTDGSLISTSGLYGERFLLIDVRLNVVGGSLTKLIGLQNADKAQDASKTNLNNNDAVLKDVIKATVFRATATNTTSINVSSTQDFRVGDRVYITSDTQNELIATIRGISGNRVTLNIKIPQKYRPSDFARMYKDA